MPAGLKYVNRFFKHANKGKDDICSRLLFASLAKKTWCKYNSALRAFTEFTKEEHECRLWPLNSESEIKFVTWLFETKKLSHTTIVSYLSAIRNLHGFLGICPAETSSKDRLAKILKGIKNLKAGRTLKGNKGTIPVTVRFLRDLRRVIKNSNWGELKKRSFWTCCLLAFFGSFRLSELLGDCEHEFDAQTNFCWTDVLWVSNSQMRIKIKLPKVNKGVEEVDLFKFGKKLLCPLRSLKRLTDAEKEMGLWVPEKPVFLLDGGACLTVKQFSLDLKNLTKKMHVEKINLRSFRSGIPSLLERHPDLAADKHIKDWGRWRGKSYRRYMRSGPIQKKWIFKNISTAILREI